jgi:hypothetical protein
MSVVRRRTGLPMRFGVEIAWEQVTERNSVVLALSLKGNSSLREELDLEYCEIGNEGLLRLGRPWSNSALECFGFDDFWTGCGFLNSLSFFRRWGLKRLCLNEIIVMLWTTRELCVAVVDGLPSHKLAATLIWWGCGGTWLDDAPSRRSLWLRFTWNLRQTASCWNLGGLTRSPSVCGLAFWPTCRQPRTLACSITSCGRPSLVVSEPEGRTIPLLYCQSRWKFPLPYDSEQAGGIGDRRNFYETTTVIV